VGGEHIQHVRVNGGIDPRLSTEPNNFSPFPQLFIQFFFVFVEKRMLTSVEDETKVYEGFGSVVNWVETVTDGLSYIIIRPMFCK
jgi:hypothetical protein